MKHNLKRYGWLFAVNLFISAFTFGGGYVVVPMVRRFFVVKKKYFTEEELIDMAAIAQSTPGAIAINLCALAGYRSAGIGGALLSCFAAVIPPFIILGCICACYRQFIANPTLSAMLKGMEAGAAALIADLITDMCSMILKKRSLFYSAMVPLTFMANFIFHIHVALILAVCCLLCIVQVFFGRRNQP